MKKELSLNHPLKYRTHVCIMKQEGLHMTEDEYKIKIKEMVSTITDIKILRRIYLIIVTIVGGFQ